MTQHHHHLELPSSFPVGLELIESSSDEEGVKRSPPYQLVENPDEITVHVSNFSGEIRILLKNKQKEESDALLKTNQKQASAEFPPTYVGAKLGKLTGPSMGLMSLEMEKQVRVSCSSMQREDLMRHDSDFLTKLHHMCGRSEEIPTIEKFKEVLECNNQAVFMSDGNGRLPLHILGNNYELIRTAKGRKIATAFAKILMETNPAAITTTDNDGMMPFVGVLHQWVHEAFHVREDEKKLGANWMFVSTFVNSFSPEPPIDSDSQSTAQENNLMSTIKEFPIVEITNDVEWAIEMLSEAMDILGGKTTRDKPRLQASYDKLHKTRASLASNVAAVPFILKTILLVDDDEVRSTLLGSPIVRMVLLSPATIGPWLPAMIVASGIPSKRAVDYFVELSALSPEDYVGGLRTPDPQDVSHFENKRAELYETIIQLGAVIPCLAVLENSEIERAADTRVIWYLMGRRLSRPFNIGLIIADFVLHVALLIAFRTEVTLDAPYSGSLLGQLSAQIAIVICAHHIIRKLCEAIAALRFSRKVFQSYIFNGWNIMDTATILATFVVFILTWESRGTGSVSNGEAIAHSFVLGLLWLRILGYVKVINEHMATFILSLVQIVLDIRYFLLVLLAVILMFADMIHLILATGDPTTCAGAAGTSAAEFCTNNRIRAYLGLYSVLLGNFSVNDFYDAPVTAGLMVLFLLFGVIILLNILIAVISDAYQMTRQSSVLLLGRARVVFLASQTAVEVLLQPGSMDHILGNSSVLFLGGWITRWIVVISLFGTLVLTEAYLVYDAIMSPTQHNGGPLRTAVYAMFALLLAAAMWVLSSWFFGVEDRMRQGCSVGPIGRFIHSVSSVIIKLWSGLLMGISMEMTTVEQEDPWQGRMKSIDQTVNQAVSCSGRAVLEQLASIEQRLMEQRAILDQVKAEVGQVPSDKREENDPVQIVSL